MKKISFKMPAFSLAEALITLLIVCLITLASIPILTKKKRIANNGAHGSWMCTYNSERKLVHWSSSEPKGDVNNPETWAEGCSFIPPVNASVFNITAIGAGGTGGDGNTELELIHAQRSGTSNLIIRRSDEGLYRVLVAGAGGGGGEGKHRSDHTYNCDKGSCGTGGAGASGGHLLADMYLYEGTYETIAGAGGGTAACRHKGCSNPGSARGGEGGWSRFRNDANTVYIHAKGGEGGQSIGTSGTWWCRDRCRYGQPGIAPTINIDFVAHAGTMTVLSSGLGYSGQMGGPGIVYGPDGNIRGNQNIQSVYTDVNALSDAKGGAGFNGAPFSMGVSSYGAGGYGSKPNMWSIEQNKHPDSCYPAGNGDSGAVMVYKIKRLQGLGGGAAKPEERLSMTIKGKIDIQIGNTYSKDSVDVMSDSRFDRNKYNELRTTRVIITDKQGRETKRIIGHPGEDGSSKEQAGPDDGIHSYLTENGGGSAAPAVCRENGTEPIYETKVDKILAPVCEKVKCELFIDGDDITDASIPNTGGYNMGDGTGKTVLTLLDNISTGSLNAAGVKTYVDKISSDYFKEFYSKTVTSNGVTTVSIDTDKLLTKEDGSSYKYFKNNAESLDNYYNYNKAHGSYPNLSDVSKTGYCFDDGKVRFSKVCADEIDSATGSGKTVEITPGARIIGEKKKYECEPAGNANRRAFGAGGGGGYAFTIPDTNSKGGMGAPGAVIIEW